MYLLIFIDECFVSLQSLLDPDVDLLGLLETIDPDDMTRNIEEELASMSPAASNMYFNDDTSMLHHVPCMSFPPHAHIPSNQSNVMFPQRTPNPVSYYPGQGASCYQDRTQTPPALHERRKRAASFSVGEPRPASYFREANLVKASSSQTIRSETRASWDINPFPERVPPPQGVSSSTVPRNLTSTSAIQKEKVERRTSDNQFDMQSSLSKKDGSIQQQSPSATGKEEQKKTEVSASGSSKPAGK